jgi:hypothetical protein
MRQVVAGGLIAATLIVIAAVGWFFLRGEPGAPAPDFPPITGPERAEDARALLAELTGAATPDYDRAYDAAERFRTAGQLADAQLLYFFAARNDHAPSAFALAEMNDPNHHSPATSLLPEPDGFQALRWYTVAREHGMDAAAERIDALRAWAERAAARGDVAAERLLLQLD